jgi:hypothetical protein
MFKPEGNVYSLMFQTLNKVPNEGVGILRDYFYREINQITGVLQLNQLKYC